MSYGRWYGSVGHRQGAEPRGVVQIGTDLQRLDGKRFTLPEGVLRLAQREYEAQYGHDQDYERMQERGGLSVLEVIGLLADYVERLGGKPTAPRAAAVPTGNEQ